MAENEQIQEMAAVIEMGLLLSAPCGVIAECLYEEQGYRKMPDNIGDFSDGYHTFNELYHHRAVLFSVICNTFPEKAWKSKLHDTGDMFEGMFIVGIETEQGQATYHYDIEPYWNMFRVKELEKAPKWDGHSSDEAINRIRNMLVSGYRKVKRGKWERVGKKRFRCTACKSVLYLFAKFCPECGADMRGDNNDEG